MSVLTTCIDTKPCPSVVVAGTSIVSWVEVWTASSSGPALTGTCEVATKKLTTEPGVKLVPLMTKRAPTNTTGGMEVMIGVAATAAVSAVESVALDEFAAEAICTNALT